MASCSVAGLDLLEIKTYGGQRHLGTPVNLPLYNRNLWEFFLSGVKGTFNKSREILPRSSVPPRLHKGSFCSKVEQFHLCPGWKGAGGGQAISLSAQG